MSDVQKMLLGTLPTTPTFSNLSFTQMMDYLLGKSKQCPSFANNYYGYQLAGLVDLLPKSIAVWQEKHDRLLQVLSQQTIWSYLDYRIWRKASMISQQLNEDEGLAYFELFWDKTIATGSQVQHNLWGSFAYRHYYALHEDDKSPEDAELREW